MILEFTRALRFLINAKNNAKFFLNNKYQGNFDKNAEMLEKIVPNNARNCLALSSFFLNANFIYFGKTFKNSMD